MRGPSSQRISRGAHPFRSPGGAQQHSPGHRPGSGGRPRLLTKPSPPNPLSRGRERGNRKAPESLGIARGLLRATLPLFLLAACQPASPPTESTARPAPEAPLFVDATEASGLDFVHENGRDGGFYFIEMVGGGGALFDYDNDGDLDLYLVQSTVFEPPGDGTPPTIGRRDDLHDRLFRNDLEGPGAEPRFVDVTAEAGLLSGDGAFGYGMGVATGDVDGDGWTDLYVTAFGSNVLWRNRGPDAQGRVTFEDVTAAAGVDDRRWSTSASFVDFDRDGRLDLYVVNYVDYDLGDRRRCSSESGRRDYCGPQNYSGEPDRLLRNLGPGPDGVVAFEDVSGQAGILSEYGSGLGVVTSDFDGDGLPDLYVANDLMPNLLWRNQGDGTFVDEALLAGCAINMEGAAEASMGVDAGDFDDDGDDDLFITHLADETNTLYLNDGSGLFEDRSLATQLGAVSLTSTGFGTAMVDFDNDGWLDLVAANGAVHIIEAQARAGDPYPFDQPNQLFRNLGPQADGEITFAEVTAEAGPAFQTSEVSRGTAIGDVDNDGDADLVVVNNQGPARLLLNQVEGRHWVGFATVDTAGRTLVGTRVEVVLDGGRTLHRRARADASYCSANDPRVLAGLGGVTIERVRVTWPDGLREEFQDVDVDRYHSLVRGSGQSLEGS